jgi:hypothetical protein
VGCTNWTSLLGIAGGDFSCFGGNGSGAYSEIPGALLRGGSYVDGSAGGVFAVSSSRDPSYVAANFGFRCAR